jgi:hypothetical protein
VAPTVVIETSLPEYSSPPTSKSTIAGVVVGVVAGVLIFGICLCLFARHMIKLQQRKSGQKKPPIPITIERPTIGETPSARDRGGEQLGLVDEDRHEQSNQDGTEQTGVTDDDSLEQYKSDMEQTGVIYDDSHEQSKGDMEQLGIADEDSFEQPEDKDRDGMEQTGEYPRPIPLKYPKEIFG